ncbi:hypothetical protein BaRGS_00011549 [Batillaria attramentaria]|uniref:Uncharacterized protein n=1 Tax=Batillaria attramentaria TaxID=370345 RepID=A0ABD0LCX9_9CAEN
MSQEKVTATALSIEAVRLSKRCCPFLTQSRHTTKKSHRETQSVATTQLLHSRCCVMYGGRHYNFTGPRFGCLPWVTSALRHHGVFEIFPSCQPLTYHLARSRRFSKGSRRLCASAYLPFSGIKSAGDRQAV